MTKPAGCLPDEAQGRHMMVADDASPRVERLPKLLSLLADAKSQHRTSAAAITETLRMAIIEGVLAGGAALRQEELAATLAVSRMPVREALRQLEVEGLIEFTPHKGAVVATIDANDVEEIAELRAALEGLALTLSFPHLTPGILNEAEAVLDRLDDEPELPARNAFNRAFHTLLYSGVQRRRLPRQIQTLYDSFDRYLRLEHSVLDRRTKSQEEHRRILSACRRKNLPAALGELHHHIVDAGLGLAAFLRGKG